MTSWAHLNEEGMKQFGDIFPDGTVPIRSILPAQAILPNVQPGDGDETQEVYIVNVSALKPEALDKVVQKIAHKFQDPYEEVKKSITGTEGIVLRSTLTSGVGIDDLSCFDLDEMNDSDEDIGEGDDEEDEDW
jgi:hypothetical protein